MRRCPQQQLESPRDDFCSAARPGCTAGCSPKSDFTASNLSTKAIIAREAGRAEVLKTMCELKVIDDVEIETVGPVEADVANMPGILLRGRLLRAILLISNIIVIVSIFSRFSFHYLKQEL